MNGVARVFDVWVAPAVANDNVRLNDEWTTSQAGRVKEAYTTCYERLSCKASRLGAGAQHSRCVHERQRHATEDYIGCVGQPKATADDKDGNAADHRAGVLRQ